MSALRSERPAAAEVGVLLRQWRSVRGLSQLDLALEARLSQRHVSFVESGRSTPSREKLMDMAQALDVPLRERNTLLLAAGYAPLYSDADWNAPEMRTVRKALERMLVQHEPYPAVVLDRFWNVLSTNAAAPPFFGAFIDIGARPQPRNMLHLIFDPKGMRPFIHDWERVARGLIGRVHREATGRVVDLRTQKLLAELHAYGDVQAEWGRSAQIEDAPGSPVIPLSVTRKGSVLNYFSIISVVGAPETIAAQELRLESMFPADDATERLHAELMAEASEAGASAER